MPAIPQGLFSKDNIMAKFIFQVSKFNSAKSQLRLKERYNPQRECVTAMATLHMTGNTFLSGMHYAYQDDEGDISYSFDKNEEMGDIKVDIVCNFNNKQIEPLLTQIAELGDTLSKPPKDDNGVSELRGYQLHVTILPGEEVSYTQVEEEYRSKGKLVTGQKLEYKLQASQIKSVKIVTQSDESYIEAPGSARMDLDLAMRAIYTSRKTEETPKPQTVEEARAVLLDFSKAKSRGAKRKEAKAAKQAALGADAVSTASSESVEQPVAPDPTPSQIILVDEDEDEDKPE